MNRSTRTRRRSVAAVPAALAATALLLASCGDSDSDASGASGDSTATSAEPEAVEAAQPRILTTYDGGILTLDADTLEVISDDKIEGFNRLNPVGDGRRLVDATLERFGRLDLLVNNAGGARGLEPILETDSADWRWMYEANVMGTLQVTRAMFPQLEAAEAPQIINVVSVAGRGAYRNGAGYNAAKFGQTALTDVMRMEFAERGVRVCQVDPGRVATDFSLNRFKGDKDRADEVYADKLNLVAEDIGETIRWIADRPRHMDVESIMIRPLDQV